VNMTEYHFNLRMRAVYNMIAVPVAYANTKRIVCTGYSYLPNPAVPGYGFSSCTETVELFHYGVKYALFYFVRSESYTAISRRVGRYTDLNFWHHHPTILRKYRRKS
jgi:hypothetical protein